MSFGISLANMSHDDDTRSRGEAIHEEGGRRPRLGHKLNSRRDEVEEVIRFHLNTKQDHKT